MRKLEKLNTRTAAKLASADKTIAAADKAKTRAEEARQKAADKAAELVTQLDAAKADAGTQVAAAETTNDAATDDAAKKAAAVAAREAATLAISVRKLEMAKTRADAALASADKALAAADRAKAKAEELKQTAAANAADLATQLDTAKTDADAKVAAAAAAKDATKEADTRKTVAADAAREANLALAPVSVYISRATRKLYVRRNTHKPWPDGGEVFDATIEVPVAIRDPQKPLGTHVFTAMASDNGALRWSAVTIDGADNATDALDRITVPQDVLDRIAPTALPRSSIIVSDEPLSAETNYRTEFVAVLSNYPQGGFITRKPTANSVAKAKDGFGFFPSFQRKSGRSSQWDWLQPPRR